MNRKWTIIEVELHDGRILTVRASRITVILVVAAICLAVLTIW